MSDSDDLGPAEPWDTSTLERRLIEAGESLSEELKQDLLAQGEGIVPALIEVLNCEDLHLVDGLGEGWLPIHAANLLGELKAAAAIPHLVRWLLEAEEMSILKNRLPRLLSEMGEPAFAPLMAAYRQEEEGNRSYLLEALSQLGHRDEELYQLLLKQLQEEPVLGAINLSLYKDPRALPVLSRALDEWQVSEPELFKDDAVIEFAAAIEALGGQLSPEQRQKVEAVRQGRIRLFERRVLARSPYLQETLGGDDDGPVKLGRNDPCWCGSGRKYKKCHLDEDQRTHDVFEDD